MILVVPEVLLTQKVVKRLYQSEIMDKISIKKAWIGVSTSIDFWLRMLKRGFRNSIQYQRDMIGWQEITPVCYHWRLLYVAALMCKSHLLFVIPQAVTSPLKPCRLVDSWNHRRVLL